MRECPDNQQSTVDEQVTRAYGMYRKLVINISWKILKDYHKAQDVCQEVFIKLHGKLTECNMDDEYLHNWLSVVTTRQSLDYLKKASSRHEGSYEQSLGKGKEPADTRKIEKQMEINQLNLEIFQELKKANPSWYEVLLLREVDALTAKEIARYLSISQESVRSQVSRAKKWIRKKYSVEYEDLE